jgi:uncharacterized protein YceK
LTLLALPFSSSNAKSTHFSKDAGMVRYLITATFLAPFMLSGCMSSARRLTHTDGGFFTKPYAATTADALIAIGVPVTHSDDPKQEATPVSPILRTAAAVDTPFTFAADTVLLPGDAIATAHRTKDE